METIQIVFFECLFSISDGTPENTIIKFKEEVSNVTIYMNIYINIFITYSIPLIVHMYS